jgi:electron transfer flavoprotein beta subunit
LAEIAVLLSVGRHPASGRARRADLDARALELALTQCEGDRIHAIHAGDPGEPALREYLGMGIETLTVLDAAGTGAELAIVSYLQALRPAVILCGAAAERGEGSGMLPYRLAEALGTGIVANAVAVAIRGDTARVTQALPRGARRALRMTLPLVLTVDRAAPPARMSAYGPARRATIEVRSCGVAGGSAAAPAPDAVVERPARVRPRRLRTMGQGSAGDRLRSLTSIAAGGSRLDGLDPQQAAQAIWRFLQHEGLADSIGPDAAGPPPVDAQTPGP